MPAPSADGSHRRRTSDRVKLGAIIGIVAPLCTFVYTEQQKDQEVIRQKGERLRAEAVARIDRDKERAYSIQRELSKMAEAPAKGQENASCQYVQMQLDSVRMGLLGPYSARVIISSMKNWQVIKVNGNDVQQVRGCGCLDVLQRFAGSLYIPENHRILKNNGFTTEDIDYIQNSSSTFNCFDQSQSTTSANEKPENCNNDIDKQYTSGSSPKNPPPRIYIQVARNDKSLNAGKYLSKYFKDQYGYALLPPEAVDESRLPSEVQLRYFDAEGKSISATVLTQVQTALKCLGINKNASLADFSRVRGLARPYHFELWIPKLP